MFNQPATDDQRSLWQKIGQMGTAPTWNLGKVTITLVCAFFAFIIGSIIVLTWAENQPFATLAGWSLGAVLTIFFISRYFGMSNETAGLQMQPPAMSAFFIMFIAIGFAFGADLLALAVTGEFLPSPELASVNLNGFSGVEGFFMIVFMIFLQPVAEELVFRGVAFPVLRQKLRPYLGILVTAVLYGAFHFLVYPPNMNSINAITPIWYGFVTPMLAGIVIGMFRSATGSTRAAIYAHIAFGLFAVLKVVTIMGGLG